MAFSEKSVGFLFENHSRNSKIWFNEHKDTYQQEVVAPFAELVTKLTPVMEDIDSEIICTPKKISRIYRDARFSKGKSIFREGLWVSIQRKKEPFVCIPEFYFHFSPNEFGWGCGYYHASTQSMEAIRKLILAGDKVAEDAIKAFNKQKKFYMWGDLYKKNHYPEQSDELCSWLNRKTICLSYDGKDASELFSENLADIIAKDFKSIAPVYKLFIKAESIKNVK